MVQKKTAPVVNKEVIKEVITQPTSSSTNVSSGSLPSVSAEDLGDVWTEDQQKALETALKTYPSSLSANERWTKIANDVTNKTKKQCVDRYKYLSSLIKNKTISG